MPGDDVQLIERPSPVLSPAGFGGNERLSPVAVDNVERSSAAADSFCRQAPIKGRQPALIGDRESQEISIGDLTRRHDLIDINKVRSNQAEIVIPEDVAGKGTQLRDIRRNRGG